jgi:polar amino acid transport system permease protein
MLNFGFIAGSFPVFLEGVQITLLIAGCASAGALVGGGVIVALRMSRFAALRTLGASYVEVMRNTPVLVQIFVLYFGLPTIGLYPSAIVSAIAALVLQNSAYLGEIYRTGIQAIPYRQMEAAQAVGMTPFTAMRVAILPQAMRRVLPPVGNQMVFILKDTSIASTIAVAELTHMGQQVLDRSAAPYEVFLTLACFYLLLTAVVLGIVKLFETLLPLRT